MDRTKKILLYISFGLTFLFARGQQIGNYITNGSFEEWYDCDQPQLLYAARGWSTLDSIGPSSGKFSYCNGLIPNQYNTIYQLPRTGQAFLGSTFFVASPYPYSTRYYYKNRLRTNLQKGTSYCVRFHVNIMGLSTYGNDGFGIYFGDNSIDTITKCDSALYYLIPQVKCPNGIPVGDTLGWTAITGTFVATGNEKYAVLGIFALDAQIDTVLTNPTFLPLVYTDACIDDVSCIEFNLGAYAGSDTLIFLGDSVFIGRQPDFLTDSGCIWYRLPNMTSAIDTVSGLWVKPTVTTTYVVRQELDCSPTKWDTVVVSIKIDDTGLDKLSRPSNDISLAPNPTSGRFRILLSSSVSADISSLLVTNSLGQVVRHNPIRLNDNSMDIETLDLDPGLYQIHIRTSLGTVSKKFVKTE